MLHVLPEGKHDQKTTVQRISPLEENSLLLLFSTNGKDYVALPCPYFVHHCTKHTCSCPPEVKPRPLKTIYIYLVRFIKHGERSLVLRFRSVLKVLHISTNDLTVCDEVSLSVNHVRYHHDRIAGRVGKLQREFCGLNIIGHDHWFLGWGEEGEVRCGRRGRGVRASAYQGRNGGKGAFHRTGFNCENLIIVNCEFF